MATKAEIEDAPRIAAALAGYRWTPNGEFLLDADGRYVAGVRRFRGAYRVWDYRRGKVSPEARILPARYRARASAMRAAERIALRRKG
jgi:hypothetical protein